MRLLSGLFLCVLCNAQSGNLNLQQAVEQAAAKYPSVRVSTEQAAAAAAAINLARTSYLPRIDMLGQVNRATRNNVFGLLLPQTVIPSISGPALYTNTLSSVWSSVVGTLASWEPFDFGLRAANVEAAEASSRRAQASVARTRFEVQSLAADNFLTLLAAQQLVVTARASVERAETVRQIVDALVKTELRPGVDASRADAELALAQTQLIRAEQAVDTARIALAQLLDVPAASIAPDVGRFLQPPPDSTGSVNVARHPLALEQYAVIGEAKAREKVLNRTYFPKFSLQGALYARGTADYNGHAPENTGGPLSGLGPNIQNWAVGFSAYFPIFDFASIRARKQIEAHREQAEEAQYQRVVRDLNSGVERAAANLNAARRIAQNTPVQLEAARQNERQATARYRAGLSDITELAEAQRLLTETEIDDALARLNVWRALLAQAAAGGDLQPFLQQAK